MNIHHDNDCFSSDILSSLLERAAPDQAKTNYQMQLAAKIIKGIKAKGWNNKKFAEEMNLNSPSIVTKWLSGTNNFEADTLWQIQNVLGINLLNLDTGYNTMRLDVKFIVSENDDYSQGMLDANGGMSVNEVLITKEL